MLSIDIEVNEEQKGFRENKKLGHCTLEHTYNVPCDSLLRFFSPTCPWTKVATLELSPKLAGIRQCDSLHGDSKGIILRNDTGGDTVVIGSALERFLKGCEVELVVLNSCFSKHQANAIKGAVKAVVGTTDAVGDEAARRFTVAFYRALGDGLSVKDAFRDGSDAVQLHGLTDVFHSDGDLNLKLVN